MKGLTIFACMYVPESLENGWLADPKLLNSELKKSTIWGQSGPPWRKSGHPGLESCIETMV